MAAPILSFENLGLSQGTHWLFRNLDIFVGERDRLALIGRNGAGKTTLLKLIAAQIEPDEGTRSVRPGAREIGRASSRERVCQYVSSSAVAARVKKNCEHMIRSNTRHATTKSTQNSCNWTATKV